MEPEPTLFERLRRLVVGRAKSVEDQGLFHKLSLIALLAWVGLGADGLSSSAYGPAEAFTALLGREGNHTYLAIFIALATAGTVFIISYAYSRLIEHFPGGGGGYLVATALLGPSAGVLSGSALLVDYVLTIAVSVAAGGDAVFSLLPPALIGFKLPMEFMTILVLTLMNLRGVRESVTVLAPIFLTFIVTHAILIVGGIIVNVPTLSTTAASMHQDFQHDLSALGFLVILKLFLYAYSMGAGTYTGIEAVSNGVGIMREPRVETGKRTMGLMATSLAITAGGLLVCYALANVHPDPTGAKTLNTVLAESFAAGWRPGGLPLGSWFVSITIFSEALLLLIASQTGFIDGPRVMANMALDNWLPKRFATLSERFTMQNGILLIGGSAVALLALTGGHVDMLVLMYSINVFLTFSLTEFGMSKFWIQNRQTDPQWRRHLSVHATGLVLCAGMLVMMLIEKFFKGGWITLLITGLLIIATVGIKRHYKNTAKLLQRLDGLVRVARAAAPMQPATAGAPVYDPNGRTAVLLVNGFSGVGLHTLFTVVRLFSGIFKNFVFVQVGAIDAGVFKGAAEIDHLRKQVADEVQQYVDFMQQNGYYAECYSAIGVDIVEEAVDLAPTIQEKFPQAIFFGGQLVFPNDSWVIRMLHNYTVFALQRKFYLRGVPFMILPIRV